MNNILLKNEEVTAEMVGMTEKQYEDMTPYFKMLEAEEELFEELDKHSIPFEIFDKFKEAYKDFLIHNMKEQIISKLR